MNLLETYCLVCKENAINNNIEKIKNNGRLMIRSIARFISQGSGLLDSLGLNTPQNNMKNVLWNAFR